MEALCERECMILRHSIGMQTYMRTEVSPGLRDCLCSERPKTRLEKRLGSNGTQVRLPLGRASVNASAAALSDCGVQSQSQSTQRHRLLFAKENVGGSCSKTRPHSREKGYSPNESLDSFTGPQSKAYGSAMKALQAKVKLLDEENARLKTRQQTLEQACKDIKADCESKLVLEAAKAAQTASQTSQALAELVREKQYLQKRCEQLEAEKARHIDQHAADREVWRREKAALLQQTQPALVADRENMISDIDLAKQKLAPSMLRFINPHLDTHEGQHPRHDSANHSEDSGGQIAVRERL
jgi:hypothetical protein